MSDKIVPTTFYVMVTYLEFLLVQNINIQLSFLYCLMLFAVLKNCLTHLVLNNIWPSWISNWYIKFNNIRYWNMFVHCGVSQENHRKIVISYRIIP